MSSFNSPLSEVDPEIAAREIAEAVAHARKATKAARPRKRP